MNSGLLNAKHLSVLELECFPYRISATEVDWSQLTHLTFSKLVDIQETRKIFTRCTRLVYCSINISDTQTDFPLSTPLSLPHLETLLLVDRCALVNLFEFLDAPSLHVISYHSMSWPTNSRHSHLLTLLSRTGNRVESLTIDVQYYSLADLMQCFELIPFLTHFTNRACPLDTSEEQANNHT
ncbi:hypothetical protein BDZ97DRAFT_591673 [Flammula alnicola]|nr:hypothetical protein BDZ97DRAFT_591673 [Flammula alnicola]